MTIADSMPPPAADPVDAVARAAAHAADWPRVATLALETYGEEILAFLASQARDEVLANEAFSMFTEAMWRGLLGFRWECSLRTWCYTLARHAWFRLLRERARGEHLVPLLSSGSIAIDELSARLRSETPAIMRSDVQIKLAELREGLEVDDQTLLTLRVDRSMPWRDVARVMSDPDDDMTEPALERRSVALRKRFMRIKEELRTQLGDPRE
jgi:RNA polymerase sigma-70 factor (ECF subfamily)